MADDVVRVEGLLEEGTLEFDEHVEPALRLEIDPIEARARLHVAPPDGMADLEGPQDAPGGFAHLGKSEASVGICLRDAAPRCLPPSLVRRSRLYDPQVVEVHRGPRHSGARLLRNHAGDLVARRAELQDETVCAGSLGDHDGLGRTPSVTLRDEGRAGRDADERELALRLGRRDESSVFRKSGLSRQENASVGDAFARDVNDAAPHFEGDGKHEAGETRFAGGDQEKPTQALAVLEIDPSGLDIDPSGGKVRYEAIPLGVRDESLADLLRAVLCADGVRPIH
ncbi:MAG: hypothetical protein HOP15_10155 [Planctomycetes bacterium]|nr:hypothetical protein [Planctomycetota bacterium]